MQRQVVLAAGGVGRCMLVLALTGVVDWHRRTGGSRFHQSTVSYLPGVHLHGMSSCHIWRLSSSCCIRLPATRSLLHVFDP